METLVTLFAVGTIWFWIVSIILFAVITILVENEHGTVATIGIIGSLVALNYVFHWSIWATTASHPLATLLYIGLYFLVGIAWSIAKWYFFLRKQLRSYKDQKSQFMASKGATVLTPALARELKDRVYGVSAKPPSAREHKSDIMRWGTYWPFSMVGTLLNDFVRKVWEHIYDYLQSTYEKMSRAVFKDVKEDVDLASSFRNETRD